MKTILLWTASLQAPADTVVAVAARDGYDVLFAVAAALIAATFLAVLFGLLYLFFQTRAAIQAVERMRRSLLEDPSVESLRRSAAHVEAISKVVKDEATELTESLGSVSDRIRQASDRMEERIEEFNALIEVVQNEAEGVFLDTASTARGVRSGLRRGLSGTSSDETGPDQGDRTQGDVIPRVRTQGDRTANEPPASSPPSTDPAPIETTDDRPTEPT